jgi:hypothetical protein
VEFLGEGSELSSRLYFRTVHALHPDESLIRIMDKVESKMHAELCETPFSVSSYEFAAGGEDGVWRQWICWCGEGTYVERIK